MSKMKGYIVSVLACLCLIWIIQVRDPVFGVTEYSEDGNENFVKATDVQAPEWDDTFLKVKINDSRGIYIPLSNVIAWWEQGSDEK